jgi:O-antigen ligase
VASFLILCAVAALAPLPFGSTDPVTIAVWCVMLGVALVLAPLRHLARAHFVLLGGVALVIAAYGLVLHEQLAAHPWLPLATPHPVWKEASDALGLPLEPSVSIARNQPYFALGAPLADVLALLCGIIAGADRRRARTLVKVIAWSGVAYAVFGIIGFVVDPTKILWRDKIAYQNVLTATFINRNTAAPYFGACATIWLLLLCDAVRRRLPPGPVEWRKLAGWLFFRPPAPVLRAFTLLFVCLAAMFMTGSRAGVVLSLLAQSVAFTLFFRRDLPRRSGVATTLLGGAAMALVLLQFMGAGVNARFDLQGAADDGRFPTYRAVLRIIADRPWLGTGLGTFAWAYPAYRPSEVSMAGVWDRAHNTLLEIAADMGVPLAALVVVAWATALVVLVRGAGVRRHDRLVPVAALAVSMLTLLHSLVDFPLQIPGFALVVFALVGAGLGRSLAPETASAPDRPGAAQAAGQAISPKGGLGPPR